MKRLKLMLCLFGASLISPVAMACTNDNSNASETSGHEDAIEQKANNFTIKRGSNISHWLSQSAERGEDCRQHIKEADFARLEELGFDFVRLPIDEEQFWDEQGNKLPEAWQLLHNALNWAIKHHLRTIVDMHVIRSHNFNAVNEGKENVLFTSDKAQQSYINMWYELSDVLKAYSTDSVAYELINEPVADEHEQWNQLIFKAHKALRQREPQRTLVIGSNKWQGTWTFKYLRVTEGDKNIILSFHYYEPQALTHYGAPWAPIGQYRGKLTYPGRLISQEDYDAAPESLKPILTQYACEWNRDRIAQDFRDAIAVAKKYGLQLYCGEWGVYEPVDRTLAYSWTRDMLSVFEQYNIAWASWCYDNDFGFWDQKTQSYKDRTLVDLLTGKII